MPKERELELTKNRGIIVSMVFFIALMLIIQIPLPGNSAPANSGEEPMGFVGDDFIISFDDDKNAQHPSIAITPSNGYTKDNGIAGNIHVVWDELNEETGVREIHYSMSMDSGSTWTGEKGDRIISYPIQEKVALDGTLAGDAVNPSITVDSYGRIHVIWTQKQSNNQTWEIFYSRSDTNGETWTGETKDIPVSFDTTTFYSHEVSAPKIAAGIIPGVAQPTDLLYAVWSEYDAERKQKEIFYSWSDNYGDSWSGSAQNQIISLQDTNYASDPVISVSGPSAEFVQVSWIQKGVKNGFDEVYFLMSEDRGMTWNPELEQSISPDLGDSVLAKDLTMVSYMDNVHLVWSQEHIEGIIDKNTGIVYSGSMDNGKIWTSQSQEFLTPINNNDDLDIVYNPSIAVNDLGEAYAYWTEMYEKSMEIHVSYNPDPLKEPKWSGQELDEIISVPDSDGFIADAMNVSVAMDYLPGGGLRPQVVWDELDNEAGAASKGGYRVLASQQNTEIHYNPELEWTLSVSTSGSGSVAKNPNQATYTDGTSVQLTANPSVGWSFSNWGGALSGSTNPQSLLMDSDKSVIAYFTEDQYTLTVSTVGSGSVSKNPDQATYTYGTSVELTATPDFGWEFDSWSGALSGSLNPDSVTMTGDKTVTATFTQITHDIALTSGWNLVSIPLQRPATDIPTVLSSISGQYDVIKYYDSTDSIDPWKTYRVGATTNDLTDIDHKMAFWIHTTSACTFTAYGEYPASTVINLYTGWNFVGYPTQNATKTADQALIGTGYDALESFDIDDPYLLKTMAGTDLMVPGTGYWVHVPADTTWTINW